MKILAIIQARTASVRLPGKTLLGLKGRTVLERVIERVSASKLISELAVATTFNKEDLPIVGLCAASGVRVYAGSENDVLDRFYQVSKLIEPNHIVRITADCPLMDPKVIDDVIRYHLKEKADYTSNALIETFPDGEDVEVFTFESLTEAWRNAKLASEREHVTPYIRSNPDAFKISNYKSAEDLSCLRWTLDEKKDYEFIKLIYKSLYKSNRLFGMKEILDLLKKHPEYTRINNNIGRNEGYLKSLKNDKAVSAGL